MYWVKWNKLVNSKIVHLREVKGKYSDLSRFKGLWISLIMIELMSAGLYYFKALSMIFLSFFHFSFFLIVK